MFEGQTMPAGQLHVMLWHYFSPAAYPAPTNFHAEWLTGLQQLGLIERMDDIGETPAGWTATARGRAYAEMLLTTPLPILRWLDPRSED